ncbi:MAG: hypothetical protein WKF75_08250, partial [Singulisphaera sp.]
MIGFYAGLSPSSPCPAPTSADRLPRIGDRGAAGVGPCAVGLVVLCSVSFLLPIAIWAESRVGLRLFMGRYFLPSFVVWPCVLGLSLERLAMVARHYGPLVGGRAGSLVMAAPRACCATIAATALAIGLRHYNTNELASIKAMKHIAASIHDRGLDFVSGNSYVFLAVWNHAGRSAERMKYVPLAERKGDVGVTKRADTKILGTLERHFWPGVILTPERLRDSRMKCLMLRGERNAW